jgi:hypothetical protein
MRQTFFDSTIVYDSASSIRFTASSKMGRGSTETSDD